MKRLSRRFKGLTAILLSMLMIVSLCPSMVVRGADNLNEFWISACDPKSTKWYGTVDYATDEMTVNDIYEAYLEEWPGYAASIGPLYEITGWKLWGTVDSGCTVDASKGSTTLSGTDKIDPDTLNKYVDVKYPPLLLAVVEPIDFDIDVKNCDGTQPGDVADFSINIDNYESYSLNTTNKYWLLKIRVKDSYGNTFYLCKENVSSSSDIMSEIKGIIDDGETILSIELINYYGYTLIDDISKYSRGYYSSRYNELNAKYVNYGDGLTSDELDAAYGSAFPADYDSYHYELSGWSLWALGSGGCSPSKSIASGSSDKLSISNWMSAKTVDGGVYVPVLDHGKTPKEYTIDYKAENDNVQGVSNTFVASAYRAFAAGEWGSYLNVSNNYYYDLYYGEGSSAVKTASSLTNDVDFWTAYDALVKNETDTNGSFDKSKAHLIAAKTDAPKPTTESPAAGSTLGSSCTVYLESETANAGIYYYVSDDATATAEAVSSSVWQEYDSDKGIEVSANSVHGVNQTTKIFTYAKARMYDRSSVEAYVYNVNEDINVVEANITGITKPAGGDNAFDTAGVIGLVDEYDSNASAALATTDITVVFKDADGAVVTKPDYNTTYTMTAEVSITADGYVFADDISECSVSNCDEGTASIEKVSDTEAVITAQFTTAKEKILGISYDTFKEYDNGTALSAIKRDVSDELTYKTESGKELTTTINWNFDNFILGSYVESVLNVQTFTISGTYDIPDDYDLNGFEEVGYCDIEVGEADKVKTPVVSVTDGTLTATGNGYYVSDIKLSISSETEGATIYYTTDGSAPNRGSAVYTGEFVLSGTHGELINTKVRAIAVKSGMYDSEEGVGEAKIKLPSCIDEVKITDVQEPIAENELDTSVDVAILSNGNNITSKVYNINEDTKKYNIEWKSNGKAVTVADYGVAYTFDLVIEAVSEDYIFEEIVETPSEVPLSALDDMLGDSTGIKVTADKGEVIKTELVSSSKIIVTVKASALSEKLISVGTVKEITVPHGTKLSDIVIPGTAEYVTEAGTKTGDIKWDKEKFAQGSYDPEVLEEQSFVYAGDVMVPDTIDKNGVSTSITVKITVLKADKVAPVVFTPESGEYTENQKITLATETEGAEIYYTLDGTEPTASSLKYTGPITVSGNEGDSVTTKIRAIAVKHDMYNSDITEAGYIIKLPETEDTTEVTTEVTTEAAITDDPRTSDDANLLLIISMMMMSGVALVVIGKKKRQ